MELIQFNKIRSEVVVSGQLRPYPLGMSNDKASMIRCRFKYTDHELIRSNKKMQKSYAVLLSFCFLFVFSCSKDNSEITPTVNTANKIEHSTSGWELYSWKIEHHWKYSILIGTSRIKTYEEVTSSKMMVTGELKLKEILRLLPEGEQVTWIGKGWLERCWQGNYNNLELPPDMIIEEMRQYCKEINIILYVTD